jgi:hypothetical protein
MQNHKGVCREVSNSDIASQIETELMQIKANHLSRT